MSWLVGCWLMVNMRQEHQEIEKLVSSLSIQISAETNCLVFVNNREKQRDVKDLSLVGLIGKKVTKQERLSGKEKRPKIKRCTESSFQFQLTKFFKLNKIKHFS